MFRFFQAFIIRAAVALFLLLPFVLLATMVVSPQDRDVAFTASSGCLATGYSCRLLNQSAVVAYR